MFLGFPLRTARTTTDDDTMPLFGPSSQAPSTSPASTRRVTSLDTEKCT
jgi:hypothetical protein